MSHTPLSTNRQGDVIFNAKGIPVVCDEMYMPQHDMADRIVACVNACAGTTTDDLNRIAEAGGWNKVSEQWSEELQALVGKHASLAIKCAKLEQNHRDSIAHVVRTGGLGTGHADTELELVQEIVEKHQELAGKFRELKQQRDELLTASAAFLALARAILSTGNKDGWPDSQEVYRVNSAYITVGDCKRLIKVQENKT